MSNTISKQTRTELLGALRDRYERAPKEEKTKVLDEFVAVAGCHRKHAIRLLAGTRSVEPTAPAVARRTYDEAVREALIVLWEAADRICGKRLKAILPGLVTSMERHGHLALDPTVRTRLLAASAATIDRLLASVRNTASGRQSLEQFLAKLPELWREGEARPTHRKEASQPRAWRTRKDPFEGVWPEILLWLQEDPEATAKSLLERLHRECPGRFPEGQLRTLQRRIREWRRVMARELVYACLGGEGADEEPVVVIGADGGERPGQPSKDGNLPG